MELNSVKKIVEIYEEASNLAINLNKSEIMFSGGISQERGLAGLLEVVRVNQNAIYLGIPTNVGHPCRAIFRTLVARVEKKLKDWKSKTISQTGNLVLIKPVAQSIPTYLISCFKIPQGVLDKIRSTILRFWWGQKIYKKRTENLCKL